MSSVSICKRPSPLPPEAACQAARTALGLSPAFSAPYPEGSRVWRERDHEAPKLIKGFASVELRLASRDQVVEGVDTHHHHVEVRAVERNRQIGVLCLFALDVGQRDIAQLPSHAARALANEKSLSGLLYGSWGPAAWTSQAAYLCWLANWDSGLRIGIHRQPEPGPNSAHTCEAQQACEPLASTEPQ